MVVKVNIYKFDTKSIIYSLQGYFWINQPNIYYTNSTLVKNF